MAEVRTCRLSLRPLRPDDAMALASQLSDFSVSGNLSRVPFPYTLADAEEALTRMANDPKRFAVCRHDQLIGMVAMSPHLGYWLGRDHWGHGFAYEAASALLNRHFTVSDADVMSGYITGNQASSNILRRLGFRTAGQTRVQPRSRVNPVTLCNMRLSRMDWTFAKDPRIETERLVLRPLATRHAAQIAVIAGDVEVARMMSSIPHPFAEHEARVWPERALYKGRLGFRWGIWRKDGPLIGSIGIGGDPVGIGYFLASRHWGQGLATEGVAAFLADMLARFDVTHVYADAYVDNPASQKVLRKLGFRQTGQSLGTSRAWLEAAPMFEYRLAAADLVESQNR